MWIDLWFVIHGYGLEGTWYWVRVLSLSFRRWKFGDFEGCLHIQVYRSRMDTTTTTPYEIIDEVRD